MSRIVLGCVGCALILALSTACRADKTFVSGDWATAGSWAPSGTPPVSTVPTALDNAIVNNGATATISSAGAVCDVLRLENGSLNVAGTTANLHATDILAGVSGTGSVNHSGGSVTLNSSLSLGSTSGHLGQYSLNGAGTTLNSVDEYVGDFGTGSFTQDGTSINSLSGWLYVGKASTASGTYTMSNGTLSAVDSFVGYAGTGTFTQNGGTNTLVGSLQLGVQSGSNGTYSLFNSASLATDQLVIGNGGAGHFNLNSATASVTVNHLLNFGPAANLAAATGSTIHLNAALGASVRNSSTSAAGLAGMEKTNLSFAGTFGALTGASMLEVACQDKGIDAAGYTANFALGGLTVGDGTTASYVKLVDDSDNQTAWSGQEALYVRSLLVAAGSTLDLNGINLYYGALSGGGTILGGTAISLTAPPLNTLKADFNRDGTVNFADYLVLEANFGKSGMTNGQGDCAPGDGPLYDGNVTFADYLVLEAEFGKTVPEPASLLLLVVGGLALRRRKAA